MFDDFLAAIASARDLADLDLALLLEELDLGPGEEAEFVANPLRDRDLAFAGDLHEVGVLQVLLLLGYSRSRPDLRMGPVPVEGADQAVAQLHLRPPTRQL